MATACRRSPPLHRAATRWKPYSPGLGRTASDSTSSSEGFDPAATVMGLVAGIVVLQKKDPDQDRSHLMLAVALATAKNLEEKSFLLNLNNAMDAALSEQNGVYAGTGGNLEWLLGWDIDEWSHEPTAFRVTRPATTKSLQPS
jgi:hypothetical protein